MKWIGSLWLGNDGLKLYYFNPTTLYGTEHTVLLVVLKNRNGERQVYYTWSGWLRFWYERRWESFWFKWEIMGISEVRILANGCLEVERATIDTLGFPPIDQSDLTEIERDIQRRIKK